MCSKGCLFLGTTKKLHIFLLLLFWYLLHTCPIVFMLYCCVSLIWCLYCLLLLVLPLLDLGYNCLKIWKSTMFPFLPESTWYGTTNVAWLNDAFKFAGMTEQLLLIGMEFMLIEFIIPLSISSSLECCSSCKLMLCNILLLPLLQTSLMWLIFLHVAHIFPYTRHHLGGLIDPQYLYLCLLSILLCSPWLHPILPLNLFLSNILSKSFVLFKFSRMADCAFCASTLLAYSRTCSLVMLSFSSILLSCFIISLLMLLSFSPCINCSFNCLLIS